MIIWDNLKVTNGTSTVTISAANGISGKLNGATGTINAGGTFSGVLSGATGTINAGGTFRGALNGATGTFNGQLSNATGTFSGSLLHAGGTFDGQLFGVTGSLGSSTTPIVFDPRNPVNLPSGTTIAGQPIRSNSVLLKPGVVVYGYDNDDIVIIPVAFSDTTSQSVTVKVQGISSGGTQYNMTVTFSGTASNIQVTHGGDFPWYDGSFTGYDFHLSDVRNQSSYSITVENGDATNDVSRAKYLASNLSSNSLLGVVQTTGSKFMINTITANPRTDSFGISNFYGLLGYVLSSSSTVNSISYYYLDSHNDIQTRTGSFGIIGGSSLESVIHPGPFSCILIK